MNVLSTISLVFTFLSSCAAWDQEYCQEYQCDKVDFWFIHSDKCTYCCKECCFITISSDAKCTASLCQNTCPKTRGEDKGECIITGKDSVGCNLSKQFCKEVGEQKNNYNEFRCVDKYKNGHDCDNSNQCQSQKCSEYVHRENRCYQCIPERNKNVSTYGRERTNYCNNATEYCHQDVWTCEQKLELGEKCYNNNYACKTNKCSNEKDICVTCLQSSDCEHSDQECKDNVCVHIKAKVGASCIRSQDCLDGNCTRGYCRMNKKNGSECYLAQECNSGVCEYHTCGGLVLNNETESNPIELPPQDIDDLPKAKLPQPKSSRGHYVVWIVLLLIVLVIFTAIIVIYYKRRQQASLQPQFRQGLQPSDKKNIKYDKVAPKEDVEELKQ